MISATMAEQLNHQINRELYSAYLYLGLSAQATAANLRGATAWFMAKYNEEMAHSLKMYHYLIDQDVPIQLQEIAAPPGESRTILEMFQQTLAHEQEVTAAIHALVDLAVQERDHATNVFLNWFVTEQIEEEATVKEIIGRLKLFGDHGQGLLLIDNELATAAQQMRAAAAAANTP